MRFSIGVGDTQHAKRHTDPRTTMRHDMAKADLNRHAAPAVAAYLCRLEHRLTASVSPTASFVRWS